MTEHEHASSSPRALISRNHPWNNRKAGLGCRFIHHLTLRCTGQRGTLMAASTLRSRWCLAMTRSTSESSQRAWNATVGNLSHTPNHRQLLHALAAVQRPLRTGKMAKPSGVRCPI